MRSRVAAGLVVVLTTLAVGVGVSTGNAWAGLVPPIAIVVALSGVYAADQGYIGRCWGLFLAACGIFAVGMWLSSGRGGGWWAAAWALLGAFCVLAAYAKSYDLDYRHVAVFGVLCFVIAAASPLLVQMMETATTWSSISAWARDLFVTSRRIDPRSVEWLTRGVALLHGLLSTAGGWLSLVAFVTIGWTWARWKGWLGALALLLLGAFGMPALAPDAASAVFRWLSMGPVERVTDVLQGERGTLLGAPAVNITLLFAGIALALGGATRMLAEGIVALAEAPSTRAEASRVPPGMWLDIGRRVVSGMAAGLLQAGIILWAVACLWIALRRLGSMGGVYAFPGFPWDLSRAGLSLKTNLPGVILAGFGMGLADLLSQRDGGDLVLRRVKRTASIAAQVAIVLLAVFAPNGVLLGCLVVAVVSMTFGRALVAESLRRLRAMRRAFVSDDDLISSPIRTSLDEMGLSNLQVFLTQSGGGGDEGPDQPGSTEVGTPLPERDSLSSSERERPPRSEPTWVELLHVGSGLRAMTPLVGSGLAVLDVESVLSRLESGRVDVSGRVNTRSPLGLVAGVEGRVVVVDGAGRMAEYAFEDGAVRMTHACATGPIRCFAGKPFGTQVALAGDEPGVSVFTVAEDAAAALVDGMEGVRALAYAADGRFLCCATDSGDVTVVDLKTESRTDLETPGDLVERLAASPEGWVAALQNKRVVLWGVDGSLKATWRVGATVAAMAVCPRRGIVAVGGSRGRVQVRDAALSNVVLDGQAVEGQIVALAFEGGDLIAVARSGAVVAVPI